MRKTFATQYKKHFWERERIAYGRDIKYHVTLLFYFSLFFASATKSFWCDFCLSRILKYYEAQANVYTQRERERVEEEV